MKNFPLILLGFLIVLFSACTEDKEKLKEAPTESFRNEVAATEVNVATAERKSFDYLIQAPGKLEAGAEVLAVIEQAGYLLEVNVREGQFVNKGDVIARLDATEPTFRLEKAKIALRNSNAEYESMKMGFNNLFESDNAEQKAVVDEQLRAKSGIFLNEVELKEAQMAFDRSVVKAPISGQVADLKYKAGSLVGSNEVLCQILGTSQFILKVKVLESDISLISLNQKAEVYPISNTQTALEGKVSGINPKVDENGLVQVSITLGANKSLLPGMNARAIIRAPQNNSLVVPKDALVYRSGRAVVFSIENKESKWNYVEVGKDNGEEVEILEGLEENSTVITSNNLQLAHQAPVQIVKE
ncbi:RND family efflux transporter MFP subunit [Algoriphagus ratkowskyi]|uniref:Efflux RND transporter periplasmic adaptor subunit n=1 Tax=Algoriphagus ratkowskyi TaxID=57028 RepID=A0A2W7QU68_9BACT|nr:efflux RND transporter periplasmic adaptor subunit [Algoriphagus ratkowskyi]PZX50716.1 RND family efflux transporter MFP subunit [Algoriphagus ratkowskyi]TXD75795.1 efflux RND transporter periplasmic adaptor subunit [Algoriphagus ratkowskyi]